MLWNLNEFMLLFIILYKETYIMKNYKEQLNLYLKVYLQE